MLGRQIARYRIVEQVGSGGMSVVYRGLDTSLEREVAIKVLHPHLAGKEESRRRFSREARAVAKLHHPNILEIFDFSCDDEAESFIVTEFIRGTTLRVLAEKVRFDPPEIAAMAIWELACALEHAHGLGIIHRDLKPENVMIREDGVVKLTDFGIAKVLDRDERMTMTGALVGSPAHMAPEIIEGQEAGREADIFSLGTILYWLCCRKLPFQGNNTTQTLKLILEGSFADPRVENAAISDPLAALLARCLAREPQARFASATELREALSELLLAAGVERPAEEFAAFYADPDGYRERFRRALVERLLARAEACEAASPRDHAGALDCLNRVLALDPDNARARALLDQMKQRRRRRRQLGMVGAALAGVVLLAGVGFAIRAVGLAGDPGAGREAGAPRIPANPGAGTPRGPVVPATGQEAVPPRLPEVPVSAPSPSPPVASAPAPQPAKAPEPAPAPSRPARPPAPLAAAAATPGAGEGAGAPAPPALQNLSIRVVPYHYAKIFLDGKLANPLRPNFEDRVRVGKHRVRIESAHCLPWEQEIDVPADGPGPTVVARLDRRPALLTVQCPVKDALLLVNGTPRGTSGESERDPVPVPLPEGQIRGSVTINLSKPGFRDHELTEQFVAGQTRTLPVELEPQ